MHQTHTIAANGQSFFVRTVGRADAPFVLFLHGFPEYGGAWDHILPRFAEVAFAAAPDQRGYGLSSKPADVDAYKAQYLAQDMLALAESLAPGRPIHLEVDGGVTVETAPLCTAAGVDVLVAGSAVFKGGKLAENIAAIRAAGAVAHA